MRARNDIKLTHKVTKYEVKTLHIEFQRAKLS